MRNYLALLIVLFGFTFPVSGQTDYGYSPTPTKELFYMFCAENSILYPEVVWAQARLESGNFTSAHFKNRNNCLGIYDSRNRRYMSFGHWTECVIAYRDKVQYRYTGVSDNVEAYLSWLVKIGYASDPEYITKIRNIMRRP